MSDFDRPTSTLYERPARRRPTGNRLGDRLARTFHGLDRSRPELQDWESDGELEYTVEDRTQPFSEVPEESRYPRTRNGYDPGAVERHVAELERELASLRGREPAEAVAVEIEKIGEQTSSILLLAHEQANQLKREAQEQADRCVADAAANAVKMTEEARRKLNQLDAETDSVWQERSRLLDDARTVAAALVSLVDEAAGRFPGEADKGSQALFTAPLPISAPPFEDDEPEN